jgi:segregation and condensation protein A
VYTPVYEGPLDLLLQLIERAELDITRLALAQVTDQYLAYLHSLQEFAAEEVSGFLVIAARLIQIKSEVLLPRPPHREEGEEDPGEALAQQLILYRRFKKAAEFLGLREAAGLRSYLRIAAPPKVEGAIDLSGITLADLVSAARAVLSRSDLRPDLRTVVAPPKVTIRQKIHLIIDQLRQRGSATFHTLVRSARSRLEIVVTFLAVLELVKRQRVQANQEQLFGEITIQPSAELDLDEDFELEFGE